MPPHPSRASGPHFCRLAPVAGSTSQLDVRGVELCAAIGNLDDVVTVEADVVSRFRNIVFLVLTPPAPHLDDVTHQGFPFGRQVERCGFFRSDHDPRRPSRWAELMADGPQLAWQRASFEGSGRLPLGEDKRPKSERRATVTGDTATVHTLCKQKPDTLPCRADCLRTDSGIDEALFSLRSTTISEHTCPCGELRRDEAVR